MLSEGLGERLDLTLIDKNDPFVFGYSKLNVTFGRKTPDVVGIAYGGIVC
jgi:sulfide:quinone oxidoreductase